MVENAGFFRERDWGIFPVRSVLRVGFRSALYFYGHFVEPGHMLVPLVSRSRANEAVHPPRRGLGDGLRLLG
jgi:hypothetical protein